MTVPLVSIVIPGFNAADLIGEAIESALSQTYANVEVIVVDDGSTDGTLRVIRSFGSRIRWESSPNRGGSAARNRGVELANGEILQFLDADDLLHPHKLERQVPLLLERHSDAVYCDVEVIDLKTSERTQVYSPLESETFARCCLDLIQTSSPLHWKEHFQTIGGFDESLPCSQERDLHIRMACHDLQFQHHPEVLATVRRRMGSVSSDYHKVLCVRRGIVQRAIRILNQRGSCTDARRRCLAGMLANDCRAFIRMGDPAEAEESLKAAREIHPDCGLDVAYTTSARLLMRLLGPVRAESVIQWKRRKFDASL